MKARQYGKIVKGLVKATSSITGDRDKAEALALYLVGCAVSVFQEPTEERCQEIYGLLGGLADKNRTTFDAPQLSEDEVKTMIEAMRVRGELTFESEGEVRGSCEALSREELVELICAYWKKGQPGPH